MKKRFFSALLCLCLLIGLVPGAVTTAFAAGDYKIGDTVNFAGYEWYIIGTDEETDGGVTAPAGCYTLLAKNNEFGSTTFRASGDTRYIAIVYYKDSDLQEKMTEIANGFSQEDRNNIQTRTLKYGYDGILGYDVENQYLWPLSYDESKTVDSLRIWGDVFIGAWSRTGIFKDKPDYGVWLYSSYQSAAVWDSYEKPDQTYNVRPALYVKQEAVKPPTVQPHVDFYLSADTISNASVGENLVANSGDDTPLTRSENQNADVRAYSDGGTTQYGTSLLFHFSSATIGANQVVACVLTDEDGNEFELELADTMEHNGITYHAMFPAVAADEKSGEPVDVDADDEEYGLVIMKVVEENGEELLSTLDSDEELDEVYQLFMERFFPEDGEEDNDD